MLINFFLMSSAITPVAYKLTKPSLLSSDINLLSDYILAFHISFIKSYKICRVFNFGLTLKVNAYWIIYWKCGCRREFLKINSTVKILYSEFNEFQHQNLKIFYFIRHRLISTTEALDLIHKYKYLRIHLDIAYTYVCM